MIITNAWTFSENYIKKLWNIKKIFMSIIIGMHGKKSERFAESEKEYKIGRIIENMTTGNRILKGLTFI